MLCVRLNLQKNGHKKQKDFLELKSKLLNEIEAI